MICYHCKQQHMSREYLSCEPCRKARRAKQVIASTKYRQTAKGKAKTQAFMKAMYDRLKSAGLCVRCGTMEPPAGFTVCFPCRVHVQQLYAARQAAKKAAHARQ